MSEPNITTPGGTGQLRTLAVRISEDLRARLDIVAQLTGRSTTEEIRVALEYWIDKTKADPEILKAAAQVRADIERKAQTERDAITAIFGEEDAVTADETEAGASGRTGVRKGKSAGE